MKLDLPDRPRRNRKSETVRAYHRETTFGAEHLIYPLFIQEAEGEEAIASMPGCARLGPSALLREIELSMAAGIQSFVLFPATPEHLKTPGGEEAFRPGGLVQTSLRTIKMQFPECTLVTDVALDPYSTEGHDGLVSPEGTILNDETVSVLVKQAVSQAEAGADIIAPSDMMDGRVGAIRSGLDEAGFENVSILSYTAKYASSFYGPFRDALDSAPKHGDKKTYQMDPANVREALREVEADECEGADMLMVKPAGPYLDVIRAVREATHLPVAAYQVSGEYAMLMAASERGWLDGSKVIPESLLAIRRAGADVILTYFARRVGEWLRDGIWR